ncbi:hypothetical protein ES703_84465 [subsurface metagenome]|jgi:hypothetical protein
MNNLKLEPGDILVNVNRRNDPFSKVKRWLAGPYEHVFMYMGRLGLLRGGHSSDLWNVPMLFESSGRGVVLQSLSNRYQEVVVMRLKAEADRKRIPRVLDEAIKLASDSQSYYDYLCIVRFAIPRLICEKLGLPMPLKYHRDPWHICSEAVNEVFIQGGLELLYLEDVPLPGDFVTDSLLLEKVWAGRLSEELV